MVDLSVWLMEGGGVDWPGVNLFDNRLAYDGHIDLFDRLFYPRRSQNTYLHLCTMNGLYLL